MRVSHRAAACFVAAALSVISSAAHAADPAHLARLEATGTCIGCDLSGADFFGADLSRAVLSGADLSGADMTAAILYFAILQGADLSGAVLGGSDLYGADLFRADLTGAETATARICHTVLPSGQRSYNQCHGFSGGF